MRYFGARIPARALCALRAREAGGVFVQAPRVLPLVRRAVHGRERCAPGRRGDPAGAGQAMGAVVADPARPALACSGRSEAIWDDLGLKEASRTEDFQQTPCDCPLAPPAI